MKRILLASVAALGLAGTASAADLAVKAPVVYAPAFTWTGCYLGINGGWIGGDDSYTSQALAITGGFTVAQANASYNSYGPNESAGTAGGQFGCQGQVGSFVFGAEFDYNWSGLSEDSTYYYNNAAGIFGAPWYQYTHKQLDWFSTARLRAGLAWDRVLVFVTGGLAVGALDAYSSVDFIPGALGAGVAEQYGAYREKRIGWTLGGGIEWAFANNWTAKAEFLYLDFGSFDYVSPYSVNPVFQWTTHVDAQEYVARVGINYLFHTGGAPVVAKY